jgi:hypothetical protein
MFGLNAVGRRARMTRIEMEWLGERQTLENPRILRLVPQSPTPGRLDHYALLFFCIALIRWWRGLL